VTGDVMLTPKIWCYRVSLSVQAAMHLIYGCRALAVVRVSLATNNSIAIICAPLRSMKLTGRQMDQRRRHSADYAAGTIWYHVDIWAGL